ncbi:MAG TPA: BCD family MFS transporter [Steroidobacteraceae bacterium]|nr:BCD family MFS transporter [Steroidobacteraceae bacterium]
MSTLGQELGWGGTLRLALVQSALGAVVVLTTSTLNRVMVVELGLPALVPAALVALHYLAQLMRLHHGHRVDVGGRSTPRIIGGMAVLSTGGVAAAVATAWMPANMPAGLLLALLAYLLIGIGVGAAGTATLALLSKSVPSARRPLAAALVWIMMIAGFGITAGVAGHFLRPFSPQRLVSVYALTGALAFALALLATWGVEARTPATRAGDGRGARSVAAAARTERALGDALRQLWSDPAARRFTGFLFMSMLAFSAQELLLEPFAGLVFAYPPSRSAGLAGMQNAGVLLGMLALVAASLLRRQSAPRFAQNWMIVGTIASAAGVLALALIAARGAPQLLPVAAFALGAANGVFAVSALGSMMDLSAAGGPGREGLRMGLWGAAQALAFAAGGLGAGGAVDLFRSLLGAAGPAYALTFVLVASLFAGAAWCALRLTAATRAAAVPPAVPPRDGALA